MKYCRRRNSFKTPVRSYLRLTFLRAYSMFSPSLTGIIIIILFFFYFCYFKIVCLGGYKWPTLLRGSKPCLAIPKFDITLYSEARGPNRRYGAKRLASSSDYMFCSVISSILLQPPFNCRCLIIRLKVCADT